MHQPYQELSLEMYECFIQQEWKKRLFAYIADSAVMKHQREFYQRGHFPLSPV